MKKLFVAILAAGLVFMAGCSSESVKPTTAGTPQPKAPEAITGSSAFFKCYVSARIWAPDAQPYRAESHPEAESKGRDGKAAEWRAGFASPSEHGTKTFIWSQCRISTGGHETYSSTQYSARI